MSHSSESKTETRYKIHVRIPEVDKPEEPSTAPAAVSIPATLSDPVSVADDPVRSPFVVMSVRSP